MNIDVFYSWQSDTDSKLNNFFIKSCLESAISKILQQHKSAGNKLALSIRIDHDTKGKSGTPNVVQSIFEKIESCHIFIADVTFTGEIVAKVKDELMPNSNVLFEMGYAAGKIGWDRIITVSNTFYGKPEKLPFDLKQRRWPITYHLSNDETADKKKEIKQSLINSLVYAISQPIESGVVYQSLNPKDERVAVAIIQQTNQFAIFFHSFLQEDPDLAKYKNLFVEKGLNDREMEQFTKWLTDKIVQKGLLAGSNSTQGGRTLTWLGSLVLYLQELDQACDKILDRYSFATDELVESLHALQTRAQTQVFMFNATMSIDAQSYSRPDKFPEQHVEFLYYLILEIMKSRRISFSFIRPSTEI